MNKNLLLLGLIFASLLIVGFLLIDAPTSVPISVTKDGTAITKKEDAFQSSLAISYQKSQKLGSNISQEKQNFLSSVPKKEISSNLDDSSERSEKVLASSQAIQNPLIAKNYPKQSSSSKAHVTAKEAMDKAYETFYSSLLPKKPTPKDIEKLKNTMPPPPPILPLPR